MMEPNERRPQVGYYLFRFDRPRLITVELSTHGYYNVYDGHEKLERDGRERRRILRSGEDVRELGIRYHEDVDRLSPYNHKWLDLWHLIHAISFEGDAYKRLAEMFGEDPDYAIMREVVRRAIVGWPPRMFEPTP